MRIACRFILFFSIIFSFLAASGQKVNELKSAVTLNWKGISSAKLSDEIVLEYLDLEGASYDGNFLPFISGDLNSYDPAGSYRMVLKNVRYSEVNADQARKAKNLEKLASDFRAEVFTVTEKKKKSLRYSVVPLRRTVDGKIEKLDAFSFSIVNVPARTASIAARTYAPFSMLSTGTWYKVAVTAEGIYKMSYKFLDSLGIDVKTVNPRNIRVYGNGGGMLPKENSIPRPDDLRENPIFVSGDADGRFDSLDYVLFYGQSPHKWNYNSSDKRYHHSLNLYSDTTFYFITVDGGLGSPQRVRQRASSSSTPTHFVSSFDERQVHEQESVNLVKSGRTWYGERFDLVTNYKIPFSFPNIDPNSPASVLVDFMARTTSASSKFTVGHPGGTQTFQVPVLNPTIFDCYYCDYALPGTNSFSFTPTSSQFSLDMTFTKGNSSSSAYLNFITVNARRYLKASGNQLFFRDSKTVGSTNISQFTITDLPSVNTVWDITDPYSIWVQQTVQSGNNQSFVVATDTLREFVTFNNTFPAPIAKGTVANQNLHGVSQHNYIIITHPRFLSQANRLAQLHRERSGLKTLVVETYQVFNEFGSGSPDLTAIKDFMKMLYDKAGTSIDSLPHYLLLFGDASYSYKSVSGNSNFVPSYESVNSFNPVSSYVSDDYFGLLDDNEGQGLTEQVDVGIGRFPVQDIAQARAIVDKIDAYTKPFDPTIITAANCNTASATNNFGDWRNIISFVADDEDGNQHLKDAQEVINTMLQDSNSINYNVDKIYFDSYEQKTVPGGQRYPDVRDAIVNRVEKGALVVNYTGHGGELGWAHERVLEVSDINNWTNSPRLPLFVTATCEFSRFDDPARISAGEYVLLNPSGGSIALLSTTRLVFSGPNKTLNQNFYRNFFKEYNGQPPRIGDICMRTKNLTAASAGGVNHRNFSLLGDPALRLVYPTYKVVTTAINQKNPEVEIDTIRALSKVTISGFVADQNGNKLTTYNGFVIPTVFDKKARIKTLENDPSSDTTGYLLQKNIVYKGKASVTNGDFSFTFIVPKDIAYNFGMGRISYYVMSEAGDGNGTCEKFVIGGSNPNGLNDNLGPDIKLFMNDKNFISGGMTNENPSLFATVFDSSGINTVGTGIGHDVVAVLDKNSDQSVVLNDYYEADLNSYQSGVIRYPYKNLKDGPHTLSLKVWDINNNSSERTVDFVVSPSAKLALKHVLNYPNPFTTHTSFFFEHNQACLGMDVQIQVFTVSGRLVKTIQQRVKTEGYRSDGIEWDGRDDFGDKIGRGVYVYRIKVKSSNGDFADQFEKLVILN